MITRRMARRAAAVIVAATAAIMIVPALAAAASTPGTTAWRVTGARDLGALAPQTMKVTLVIAPRNASALKTLVSSPHAALTPAQFNARFAPAPSTVTAVGNWASANGLDVSSVSANRMLVSLAGSSTAVASAFHTALHRYSTAANGTFYKPTGAAALPSRLASQVSAVLGSYLPKAACKEIRRVFRCRAIGYVGRSFGARAKRSYSRSSRKGCPSSAIMPRPIDSMAAIMRPSRPSMSSASDTMRALGVAVGDARRSSCAIASSLPAVLSAQAAT